MERVDSLKRKFESQKLENETSKMRKLPSLLNIETRPNVKNETHKHQMFIRHVSDSFHFRAARLRVKGRLTKSGTVQGACGPTSLISVNLIAHWTEPQRAFWNFESQSLNNSTSDSKDSISKSGHVLQMRSKFLSGNASGMTHTVWLLSFVNPTSGLILTDF